MMTRPPLTPAPPSGADYALAGLAVAFALAGAAFVAAHWSGLPDRVPIHFGATDTPDHLGGEAALWFVVFVHFALVGTTGGLALGTRSWPPPGLNWPVAFTKDNTAFQAGRARGVLLVVALGLSAVLACSLYFAVQTARGVTGGLPPALLPVAAGVLLVTVGRDVTLARRRPAGRG